MSHLLTAVLSFAAGVLAALATGAVLRSRRRAGEQQEEARRSRSSSAPPAASRQSSPAPARAGGGASGDAPARPAAPPAGLAVRSAPEEKAELGPAAAEPPAMIPPPPAEFSGRAAELASLAARAGSGAPLVCVFGESGSGRRALALRLCADLAGSFPDGALRLDMLGRPGCEPLPAAEALARLIRRLHPGAKLPGSEAALSAAWASALADRKVLVLLEDAADAAQVRPLLPPAGSLLVATSRGSLNLPRSFSRELAALEDADALALLAAVAPGLAARGPEIVKASAAQPFALRLVGRSQAAPPETDPSDLAEMLAEAVETAGRGAPAALRLACSLAVEDARRFWETLAVFPGGFDLAAAAAVSRVPQAAAERMLGELAGRGLIEREDRSGVARWRLHELARAAAEERLGPAGRAEAALRHAVYFLTILRKAEKLCHPTGSGPRAASSSSDPAGGVSLAAGLALYDLEADNISAAQAWAAVQTGADETVAHLCNDFPSAAPTCLGLRQSTRQRVRWLEAAMAAARGLGLGAAEAGHAARLGPACAEIGEHSRALVHAEGALAAARAAGDRGAEANALGLLASSSAALGEHRRAVGHYEEYLPAVRWLKDPRAEMVALGNLGAELVLVQEPARAVECFEKQLAFARELGDGRAECAALTNLSAAGSMLGDGRRAAGLHEQLLAFARAGGDRRLEACALGRLASAHHALGEAARVAECCEAQAGAARECGDRRTELAALSNLAAARSGLGDHRRAAEAHERLLAAARAAGDRKAEAAALAGLGADWLGLEEPRRAIAFYDQYLEAVRSAGPAPGAALHLGNLGRACHAAGEHGRAAEAYESQLAAARKSGDRKAEANALYNLSLALGSLDRKGEAREKAEAALAAFEAIKDPNAALAREHLSRSK